MEQVYPRDPDVGALWGHPISGGNKAGSRRNSAESREGDEGMEEVDQKEDIGMEHTSRRA